jgi:Fe-S-cluster-containing hydrogenase component 2
MEAITIGPDDAAVVDLDRCIGCGLCVTTCATESLSLQLKPKEERRDPPVTAKDTITQMAEERGKTLIPLAFTKNSS